MQEDLRAFADGVVVYHIRGPRGHAKHTGLRKSDSTYQSMIAPDTKQIAGFVFNLRGQEMIVICRNYHAYVGLIYLATLSNFV